MTKNVDHLLNFYQLNGFGRRVSAPKGYKGELVKMDLSSDQSFGHGSIDKSEKLHGLVIEKIKKVALGPAAKKRLAPAKPSRWWRKRRQKRRRKICRQFPLSCRRKQLMKKYGPSA